MSATVCTVRVAAPELHEGSIAVVGGNARYLRRPARALSGWVAWEYTTHRPDGSVTGHGVMEVRSDASVQVVAVTLDGATVVPS